MNINIYMYLQNLIKLKSIISNIISNITVIIIFIQLNKYYVKKIYVYHHVLLNQMSLF